MPLINIVTTDSHLDYGSQSNKNYLVGIVMNEEVVHQLIIEHNNLNNNLLLLLNIDMTIII